MKAVQFDNGPIKMAANLFVPPGFDPSKTYASIVCVHPGGGVKEQTAGIYAAKLAELALSRWPSMLLTRVRAAPSRVSR